ncbi:hypothetical protein EJ04DRAFT_608208 [Polyplosphaeria fusca]|uniref:lytic cellulose monooxygenase (C4-dehydrogenating) n=1 Tax=Polyplosphaeria fusca TaxID=682080 RepID=A0A9P4V1P7_9PLEO|nr:hypothetical protein EJ04DRAFT_608208 [Polyplosphaeria fusca]
MKSTTLWASCLLSSLGVHAHYIFATLSINHGPYSPDWQYIRKPVNPSWTPSGDYSYYPMFDVYSTDIRCGRNATTLGGGVQTATVQAGDHLSVGLSSAVSQVSHGGPGMFYMAKVPEGTKIEEWDADGDWVKIADLGHVEGTRAEWVTDKKSYKSMNVTIPATMPPGKYLLRIEHLFLRTGIKQTNFFVSCAHLEVKGSGGGKPGPTVKFPGAYDDFDLAIWAPLHTQGYWLDDYVTPGPSVWKG